MQKIDFELREGEEFIQLIQLLKATNIAFNGAEAQGMVSDGFVLRNGEVELRKRAKIVAGDVIKVAGYEITVK
ncbi:MAG: RNA-binding S4 domain-containing protein [Paludibacteraceae bacterium]|nr:RNA-binding S4 domain-containing protein [Paludibacteraceae bacterium]